MHSRNKLKVAVLKRFQVESYRKLFPVPCLGNKPSSIPCLQPATSQQITISQVAHGYQPKISLGTSWQSQLIKLKAYTGMCSGGTQWPSILAFVIRSYISL